MVHPHPLRHVSALVIGLMPCSEMLPLQVLKTLKLQIGIFRNLDTCILLTVPE